MLETLDKFIKQTGDAKYAFTVNSLFKRQTIVKKDPNRLVDKDRTFFCSELIAKVYKVVNIMKPTNEACTNFLPSAFTSAA